MTRPRAAGAAPRPRLFALIDRALRGASALWIQGAPGSGKTTLASTWVAARRRKALWLRLDAGDGDPSTFLDHLTSAAFTRTHRAGAIAPFTTSPADDLDAASRHHLRRIFAVLPRGTVIVLDDVDAAPTRGPFTQLLRAAVEELPGELALLAIARGAPPASLARARAHGSLALLREDDLQLTPAEGAAIARRAGRRPNRREAEALRQEAHGWMAGFVLLLECAGRAGDGGSSRHAATFDYFAGEIFDRAPPEAQRLLLEVALLDTPSAALVDRATSNPAASSLLDELARKGTFVHVHGEHPRRVELHALFRDFLLKRGERALPPGRADEIRRAAAAALAGEGPESTEAALGLLDRAGAQEELAGLLKRVAPAMTDGGRTARLAHWLARLPRERVAADPWLTLWEATTRIPTDPVGAGSLAAEALARFEERGDAEGVWRAWAAATQSILVAWADFSEVPDRISQLERNLARHPFTSEELGVRVTLVALAAFGLHAPSHPLASRFAESARALALSAAPPALRLTAGATWLLHANWWYGAFERSQPVVDAVAPLARARDAEPSAAIHWLTMEAPHWAALGDEAGAARCAAEARAIADATGIRSWDLILEVQALWGAFRVDDLAAARAHLSALRGHARPGHATDASFVAVYEALLALRSGAAADALRRAGEAIALAERVRYAIPLVMGELLRFQASSRLGDAIEAGRSRARAAPHLAALQSPCFDQLVALLDADHLLRVGDSAGALVALRRALAFGAAGISHARYFLSPPALATLLAAAVDAGVERHAALRLAQAQSLPAPHGAGEQWPRALRVRVMGEGAIERHGLAVARAPRAPRRPLELLHALIALGGHDVPKMTLAEALWPDADGDVAHHALETTLYRLRQLVGPEVVAQRNGRLSIDQQRCWVDLLELDERVTRALAALRTGGPGAVPGGELRRIEALLTGLPFAKDGEAAWAVAARDRLRGRLARLLEPLSAAGTAPGLAALLDRIAELDGGPSPARLRLVPGGSDGQPAA